MRLYDFLDSGNGYKVRLLLAHLEIDYEFVELDILKGETRTPDLLAKNPNGRIPLLQLDDGTFLSESNAILYHLSQGSAYWPEDPVHQARVLQWMFFEQYNHEPSIAVDRFWLHFLEMTDERRVQIAEKQKAGRAVLKLMDDHLADRSYLVGDSYSIADILLYAYSHVADEGGFDLGDYPSVQRWLGRVAQQPRRLLITDRPDIQT